MNSEHVYQITVTWTGAKDAGTQNYRSYDRNHIISVDNKTDILGSSDPAFRGDKTRHNPEDLFLSSLAACHMLWYLHLCAETGIVVTDYVDNATGTMFENPDGSGRFTQVILRPIVTVTEANMLEKANAIHAQAKKYCFISNSVNFPVLHQPICKVRPA